MPDLNPRTAMQDARSLALALGMGDFQATMVIPYMHMTPATTDPDMPAIHLIVNGLQRGLQTLGATTVKADGVMGVETATELRRLTGPNWPGMTWSLLYSTIVRAISFGQRLDPVKPQPIDVSPLGDVAATPSASGGWLTTGLALGAFWYLFLRGRKAR
jgi:hypothetical protein